MDWKKINRKKLLIGLGIGLAVLAVLLWWWLSRHQTSNQNTVTPIDNSTTANQDYKITQNQKAGEKTGYKIDISVAAVPLNPYPGSTTKGTIKIINADGQIAKEVSGGVRLFIGDTLDDSQSCAMQYRLIGSNIVYGNECTGITGLATGYWQLAEDGSNRYTFQDTDRPVTAEDLATYSNSSIQPCFEGGNKKQQIEQERDVLNAPLTKLYLMIKQGRADFSYINTGKMSPLKLTAIANEEPIYPAADAQYRWNITTKDVMGEPSATKAARMANVSGYQIVGTPVHYRSADIVTTASVPFGEFKSFSEPKLPSALLEYTQSTFKAGQLDYYYDVQFSPKTLNGQTGGKFTMTIKPKALPGKTLPHTIHDAIELYIDEGYSTTAPTIRTTQLDSWLKRNYLAYFSGYNGEPIPSSGSSISGRINYDPTNDGPQPGWIPKGMPGAYSMIITSAGETITLELGQTGERSVTGFLAIRLKTTTAADTTKIGVGGRYSSCSSGIDQIVSVPIN